VSRYERQAHRAAGRREEWIRRCNYSDHQIGRGRAFYEQACGLKLEGIISKRAAAPYAPGNRGLWLKVKCLSCGEPTRLEVPRDLDQRRLTTAARPPGVETPGTSAERRDVEKSAHHRHVFQEMDLLIAVGEIRMRDQGGGDAPYREHQPHRTGEPLQLSKQLLLIDTDARRRWFSGRTRRSWSARPDPKSQVRIRLPAGGSRIRTIGTA
jgi:hypothetical protein